MEVKENVDLFPFNSFHIHSIARYLVTVTTHDEAREVFDSDLFRNSKRLILGGGSNVLFTGDFDGLVIRNAIKGIDAVDENATVVRLTAGSGEDWHSFVMHCVGHDFGGIENLSLIPGTVGAAPMQNIGAYGVEIRDVIHCVEAIDLKTQDIRVFSRDECSFGYRESVFKQALRDQYFISSITLSLTRKDHHFNIRYGAIRDVLSEQRVDTLTVRAISDAVIAIRTSKLPDPKIIGNAGSFFKNPLLERSMFALLQEKYPGIPVFPGENDLIKVPAAWLIEQCGWKGKRFGDIGIHKDQALVLVNYGGGNGQDIWQLALEIQESVREKFGVLLQPEVNVI